MTEPSLEAAYALETPEDNKALYRDWAKTYDQEFSAKMDYALPAHVADIFTQTAATDPILDVGAGTGLLAEHILATAPHQIDALDISQDMLDIAAKKNLYRTTIIGDLTTTLNIPDATYRAIVSSGTLTHGHVGPDALDELLRIAKPGAHFVIAVNAKHYEAQGFAAKFANLDAKIEKFTVETRKIYGKNADASHSEDLGHIVVFQKV